MTLDKKPPMAPDQPPPLASNKPKAWANVRRKFALITMNRSTHTRTPDAETAVSQAESFCRPFISSDAQPSVPIASETESEQELAFDELTKKNSARNVEITSATYSAPKSSAAGRSKKKKNRDKIVRFIEEPYIISDTPDEGEDEDESDEDLLVGAPNVNVGRSIRIVETDGGL